MSLSAWNTRFCQGVLFAVAAWNTPGTALKNVPPQVHTSLQSPGPVSSGAESRAGDCCSQRTPILRCQRRRLGTSTAPYGGTELPGAQHQHPECQHCTASWSLCWPRDSSLQYCNHPTTGSHRLLHSDSRRGNKTVHLCVINQASFSPAVLFLVIWLGTWILHLACNTWLKKMKSARWLL